MSRILVIASEFNRGISEGLWLGCQRVLKEQNCAHEITWVPGAFELPVAAANGAKSGHFSAIICLGAVIRGETAHFDFVAGECAAGLMQVNTQTGVPTLFGVLTTNTVQQAMARSSDDSNNKGAEVATAALKTLQALKEIDEMGSRS